MNLKSIFLLLTVCTFILSQAQINPKTKWGDVSQAEIDYKEVTFEKDAPAVILYEEGSTNILGGLYTKIYKRIKILNEKGIDAANQELMYFSYQSTESINNLKGQTINIENGKHTIYPIDKNSIYDVTINEYYNAKRFTFPNVKVGSILEFEYTFIDQGSYLIDAWEFQHEFPTLYSTYEIENNSSFDYTSLMIGEKIVKQSMNKKNLTEWTLINVPSFNSLNFIYNREDMAERIVFQLRGFLKNEGVLGGVNSYHDVLSSWKDVNEEMFTHYRLSKNESYSKEISDAIPNGKNEKETLENIYDYFKKNFKWNEFYSIRAMQSNRETNKSQTGNTADLNLLLNSVLKNKGFKTDYVLISTRDHGKLITSYPYIRQFNSVLNMVTLSDKSTYLIDASDLSYDLGYAPLRDYNHFGMIVNPDADDFILLNPPLSEYNSIQNYVVKDGHFLTTRSDKRNGYFKEKIQNPTKGLEKYNPQTHALDFFTTETKRDFKNSDEENFELERVISETSSFENTNFINIENPLKNLISQFSLTEPERERPLEFNFPFFYKTDVFVEIPDGFKVEIPQGYNTHKKLSTNELIYFQSAEIKDEKLVLHIEFYLGKSTFNKNYVEIKIFFEKINLDASKAIMFKKS